LEPPDLGVDNDTLMFYLSGHGGIDFMYLVLLFITDLSLSLSLSSWAYESLSLSL
jgi:hypothetical protein